MRDNKQCFSGFLSRAGIFLYHLQISHFKKRAKNRNMTNCKPFQIFLLQWCIKGRCVEKSKTETHSMYSLSNVIMADEKFLSFHQYLRYNHKYGTIAFSTPSAIIWAYSHIASIVSGRFSLFEHVIYS